MEETNQNQETKPDSQQAEKSKTNPMLFIGIAIAVIVLIGGYLLTQGQRKQISESVTQATQTQTTQDDTVVEDETMTEDDSMSDESDSMMEEPAAIEVEGGAYYFKPEEIRVKKGEKVRIVFTNAGGTHDFVIDELNVKTKITQTGETVEVEFTPTEAGEYNYYCNVANHRALGMEGTLIVE